MESEQSVLRQFEQEFMQLAEHCGIGGKDLRRWHDGRELDPKWLSEVASLDSVDWQALVRHHGDRLTASASVRSKRKHLRICAIPIVRASSRVFVDG